MIGSVVNSLLPVLANITADGTGLYADLQGYEGAIMVAHVGNSLDTLSGSVYLSVGFEESDASGSGFTTIATADLHGGDNDVLIDAPAEDSLVIAREYTGAKRYVRVIYTMTGSHTNGIPLSANVVRGFPRH